MNNNKIVNNKIPPTPKATISHKGKPWGFGGGIGSGYGVGKY